MAEITRSKKKEYSLIRMEKGDHFPVSTTDSHEWRIGQVSESAQRWNMVWHNLSGSAQSDDFESASLEQIRENLDHGLSKIGFARLADFMGISQESLANVAHIKLRTLNRRKVFEADESERILRIGAAFQKTVEVFEDLPSARKWFTSPKRALNQRTPLEFCDTELGATEVVHLLGRIEYGVFS